MRERGTECLVRKVSRQLFGVGGAKPTGVQMTLKIDHRMAKEWAGPPADETREKVQLRHTLRVLAKKLLGRKPGLVRIRESTC